MPELQSAIDISNYQKDLDAAIYRRWVGEGVRTVVCGTDGDPARGFPLVFEPQVAKAREARLNVEAYTYLFFGENGYVFDVAARTNRKLDLIDRVGGIKIVWLDAEQEGHGLEPWQVVNGLVYARDAVLARGYECGIYTRKTWWEPNTNDEQGFYNLRWWLAHYSPWNGQPAESLETPLCGGITEIWRRQYTDKGAMGGYGPLDLNVERVPVDAPPPPEPAPAPVGLSQEAKDAFSYVGGWANYAQQDGPVERCLSEMRAWTDEAERLARG